MSFRFLSNTQLSLFLSCELKYRFKYIDKIKVPVDETAIKRGLALHNTLEEFYKSDKLISPEELVAIYYQQYKKFVGTDHAYCSHARNTIFKYYDFFKKLRPHVRGIELSVTKPLDGIKVKGIADILLENVVVDWKTSSKVLTKLSDEYKRQMTLYSIMFDKPKSSIINISVPNEKVSMLKYTPTEEDKTKLMEDFKRLFEARTVTHKYSATGLRNAHLCPYCEYCDICEPYQRRKRFTS